MLWIFMTVFLMTVCFNYCSVDSRCLGFFGPNCRHNCSERHCINPTAPCDDEIGSCQGKCLPGFQGKACIEACDAGLYGEQCSKSCSKRKCVNDESCETEYGTCLDGCIEGWEGVDCVHKSSSEPNIKIGIDTLGHRNITMIQSNSLTDFHIALICISVIMLIATVIGAALYINKIQMNNDSKSQAVKQEKEPASAAHRRLSKAHEKPKKHKEAESIA